MLVLTRKMGEGIVLGSNIQVKVLRISGSRVTIGIEAPQEVRVLRADLAEKATGTQDDASSRPVLTPRAAVAR